MIQLRLPALHCYRNYMLNCHSVILREVAKIDRESKERKKSPRQSRSEYYTERLRRGQFFVSLNSKAWSVRTQRRYARRCTLYIRLLRYEDKAKVKVVDRWLMRPTQQRGRPPQAQPPPQRPAPVRFDMDGRIATSLTLIPALAAGMDKVAAKLTILLKAWHIRAAAAGTVI